MGTLHVPIPGGTRFDRTVVIERGPDKDSTHGKRFIRYWCLCDCGTKHLTYAINLRRGKTGSCGCKHKDVVSETFTTHGHTTGRTRGPEYETYSSMKARCNNPKSNDYHNYGGRGIRICPEWIGRDGFQTFFDHIGPKPTPNHTLDRIDPNGNYEPGNVRWATWTEQARNRRTSWHVFVNGSWVAAREAAKIMGVPYSTLASGMNGNRPLINKLAGLVFKRNG